VARIGDSGVSMASIRARAVVASGTTANNEAHAAVTCLALLDGVQRGPPLSSTARGVPSYDDRSRSVEMGSRIKSSSRSSSTPMRVMRGLRSKLAMAFWAARRAQPCLNGAAVRACSSAPHRLRRGAAPCTRPISSAAQES